MRRGINIAVALVLIALILKIMAAPNHTVASTDGTAGRNAVSVYDLETTYPNLNTLPVQEDPKP
jgi:hypothetical protein